MWGTRRPQHLLVGLKLVETLKISVQASKKLKQIFI